MYKLQGRASLPPTDKLLAMGFGHLSTLTGRGERSEMFHVKRFHVKHRIRETHDFEN